jgi:ADP-ribose pyrophosphatase YjhB (NUDIX family)
MNKEVSGMDIVRFYRGDPNPPKTTQGAHLGANVILTCQGKILLEKRRDCDLWGLPGGGVKRKETPEQAISREIYEELGLRILPERFKKLGVYGEPGRIAAYRDGSIWRMVVVVFALDLQEIPQIVLSTESADMRFFSKEELSDVPIVVTHSDIVEDWFINRNGQADA